MKFGVDSIYEKNQKRESKGRKFKFVYFVLYAN